MTRRRIVRLMPLLAIALLLCAGGTAAQPLEFSAAETRAILRLGASEIAIEDVNAEGGVMGRKVEIVARDSEFKPEVAKRKATELIEVEKAPFLVGAIVGFEGIAMAEVGCKNDVVVSFFGQNFLTVKGKMCKYQFGNNLTPYQTAAAAARFVAAQKMGKKWHIVFLDYAWGQSTKDAFVAEIKKNGVCVAGCACQ